jgi:hypothetical protein
MSKVHTLKLPQDYPYSENFQEDLMEKLNKLDKLDSLDNIANSLEYLLANNNQSPNKVVYVNTKNDNIVTEGEFILARIKKAIADLEENFDDIGERLLNFCLIKKHLYDLRKTVNKEENKYYYRSCIIIHDAISHLKSEKITQHHLNTIKYVIEKLYDFSLEKEIFYEIDDILEENGLEWIPEE